MTDTNPRIQKRFVELIMQKSYVGRLKMCTEMFDFAREVVLASLNKDADVRKELFLRFYGQDFDEERRNKILIYLQRGIA